MWPRLWLWLKTHPYLLALIGIVLLAAGFRFWRLWNLPPGLHPDEAANGLDVFRIKSGDLRVIYNTNGPRESLFFFLQAIFVLTIGNSVLALRLAPALIGTLAVVLTYFWVKEWFSRRAALLASLFMATGSWAVTMSRNGYRASMVPLMVALTAWLVTKAVKTRRWYWFVLAGVSYAAGFYTYLSWRFTPLIVLVILVAALAHYRKSWKQFFKPALIFGLAAAITLVPLGFYAFKHPGDIVARSSVSFTNPELNHGQPLQTLGRTVIETALMFNWRGDSNYRHNLGGEPMLNAFVGVMFILGVLLSLRRLKDLRYFSLLTIFGVMLLPEMLTAEGIPHGLRAIGVLPVVYIFAAIGLSEMLSRWKGVFPRNPIAHTVANIAVITLLIVGVGYDFQRYFVAWANSPQTYEAYSEDSVQAAYYLNQHAFSGNRYLIIDGYSNQTVQYLTKGKATYQNFDASNLNSQGAKLPAQIIVMQSQAEAAQAYLQSHTSTYKVEPVKSKDRPNVTLFTVYEPSH